MEDKKIEKKKQKVMDKALMQEMQIDKDDLKKLKKKLKKVESRPERGIETWFRLASKNLYTRLQIVDTKANILITANAIIISLVLSNLYPRLDDEPNLIFALTSMIITNVLSIAFAIFATIPPAWSDKKSITNTEHDDLMTFEDFSQMSIENYTIKVQNILTQGDYLYPNMISDIHSMGLRLARKYKLIRSSFLIFLYGIIISILMFAACGCMLVW